MNLEFLRKTSLKWKYKDIFFQVKSEYDDRIHKKGNKIIT